MEYGLWHDYIEIKNIIKDVLTLVLMEYGLWQRKSRKTDNVCVRLNPCSNGIWSLTLSNRTRMNHSFGVLILVLMEYGLWLGFTARASRLHMCLNPCSNGIWSLTHPIQPHLSLVCLNPCSNGIWSLTDLWCKEREFMEGLNPCSNGIWSLTMRIFHKKTGLGS